MYMENDGTTPGSEEAHTRSGLKPDPTGRVAFHPPKHLGG
jgi:hypothetical protein